MPRTDAAGDETALGTAIRLGRAKAVRALLAQGADPSQLDALGYAPLHRAALAGDAGSVLTLLEAGADPTALDAQGRTFQTYLWMTPIAFYAGRSYLDRVRIQRWLRRRGLLLRGRAPS